jgi:hypothetical protein
VKEGELLYLYLYGRESMDPSEDLELFKTRLRFHLMAPAEKHRCLLERAGGDERAIHNLHDLYAPLINRRFEFVDIRKTLETAGLQDITRTIRHTELFIRRSKATLRSITNGGSCRLKCLHTGSSTTTENTDGEKDQVG